MKTKITVLIVMFCAVVQFAIGQEVEPSTIVARESEDIQAPYIPQDIETLVKSQKDGILIRWAPTNSAIWRMGIDHGYHLEKYDIETKSFVKIVSSPIKPWTEDQWSAKIQDGSKYFASAAMAIYGESDAMGFVNQANDQENRHAFNLLSADLDRSAAEASGLFYKYEASEKEPVQNLFRIYIHDQKTGQGSDTTNFVVGYYGEEIASPPILEIIEQEQAIELEWSNTGEKAGQIEFTAYYIERSSDNVNFERLMDEPFMNTTSSLNAKKNFTSYIDSIENGTTYFYRVFGIDAFADLSPASNVVSGMGKDKTAPTNASKLTITENNDKHLKLGWTWNDTEGSESLKGFNVYRSATQEGEYIKINSKELSSKAREFLDKKPDIRRLNYYYIEAVDNNGNTSKSVLNIGQIVDRIPPSPPAALQGQIDTNGMVLIEWNPPVDDDVQGYEMYFSNDLKAGFIKMAQDIVTDKFYVDSITFRTLTEEIHYQVVAVDYNYNRSDASEVLTLKRPDLIPPAASIFTNYEVSEKGIKFEWTASTSDDVVAIILMRRIANTTEWKELDDFDSSSSIYFDTNVEEGVRYEYNLVTVDDDANTSSPAKTLVLEALKSQYLAEVKNGKLSKEKDKFKLSWDYDNAENYDFRVFQKSSNGLSMYKKVSGVTELQVPMNAEKSYEYFIKAKGKDGRESKMSNKVTIN